MKSLLELLAPEVVFHADSGGAVPAARRPVQGADPVAKLMLGIVRLAPAATEATAVTINGMPGVAALVGGRLEVLMAFDVRDGRVTAIHAIRNPAKLRRAAARLGATTGPRSGDGARENSNRSMKGKDEGANDG